MDERFTKKILFPIIRAGLDIASGSFPAPDENDLEKLYFVAKTQSIAPIIREGLRKSGAGGEGYYDKIDKLCLNEIYQFAYRDLGLEAVCSALETACVPYVPLKGSVIRDLYPEQWMRTSCDIDILIHEEDLDKAERSICTDTGFKRIKRNYHDVLYTDKTISLELHFSIMEAMDNIDALLCGVWDHCKRNGQTSRFDMSAEFLIFHTVAHMVYHITHGGLGIRPYIDLWLLQNKTAFDKDEVVSMCSSCGVLTFYESATHLGDVWLSGAEHTGVTRALEELCFGGGVFGSVSNSASAGIREKGKLGFVVRRLFPPKSIMEQQYPTLKKKSALLPFFYAKRLAQGIGKKRKKALGELKTIKRTDTDDINSMDELLKKLEL